MPETQEIFEFGRFRLNVSERSVVDCDSVERVQLPDKAFETLCILVRNGGRLVRKDELMDQLWADSFVEENNLNKCIHAVRRALGEGPGKQQFIETVKKHGFRFVAEVRRLDPPQTTEIPKGLNGSAANGNSAARLQPVPIASIDTPGPATIQEMPSGIAGPESGQKPSHKLVFAVLGVGLLLVGSIAIAYIYERKLSPAERKKTFAVLPLKPIDPAHRQDVSEIGITDALILKLNSMNGILARPLGAMRQYDGIAQDPLVAGREQQVDYVLESHYQLSGRRLRFTSQLYNVATGQVEDTKTTEADATDLFALQDSIAGDIGKAIEVRFGTPPASKKARSTANEDAYVLFLQGLNLLDRREPPVARDAIGKFEKAVELDPNYAQAWAGIAHAHRLIGGMGRSVNSDEEYRLSMDAIRKALALDANLADAHSALCDNQTQYEWNWAAAEVECKRALQLDQDSALAHQIYSRFLMGRGRFDEAIAEVKKAIELEPTSLFAQRNYGSCLYFAHRYAEAAAQLKRVVEMDPTFANSYPFLWQSLKMQGNDAEAFKWLIEGDERRKVDRETLGALQSAYNASGWPGVWPEQARQLENSNVAFYHVALSYARGDNKDKAFEYLERSYQRRELWMHVLNVEPALDSLRSDPRFDDLARRVG